MRVVVARIFPTPRLSLTGYYDLRGFCYTPTTTELGTLEAGARALVRGVLGEGPLFCLLRLREPRIDHAIAYLAHFR